MPYEDPNLANQISQKLEVFDRKLEGSHNIKEAIMLNTVFFNESCN